MNKRLVKDNAKSFDDSEGHSRDLMRCTRRPKALPRCHIHAFILSHLRSQNVALTMPYLCSHIHTSACTRQHLCCSMHAAEFTQLSCSSIDAVALTQQHWCRSSDSAAFMQHLARSSIFQLQRLSANLAFTLPLAPAAFTLQLSLGPWRSACGSGRDHMI